MRKIIFIVVALVAGWLGARAVEIDGLNYEFSGNEASIIPFVEYNEYKYSGEITIPATVKWDGKEYEVTQIAPGAFQGAKELTKVNIAPAESRLTIGAFAFAETGVTEFSTEGRVSYIGNRCFWNGSLESIKLGRYVEVADEAFAMNESLRSLVSEDNYSTVKFGNGVFKGNSLEEITVFPPLLKEEMFAYSRNAKTVRFVGLNKDTRIPNEMFFGSNKVEAIYIPKEVTDMNPLCFAHMNNLKDVYLYDYLFGLKGLNCPVAGDDYEEFRIPYLKYGPFIGSGLFATLHVPQKYIDMYENGDVMLFNNATWYDFQNIVAWDPEVSAPSIESGREELKVEIDNGTVSVEAAAGTTVTLVSIDGISRNARSDGEAVSFDVEPGIYVVEAGGASTKILVR